MDSSAFRDLIPTQKEVRRGCFSFILFLLVVGFGIGIAVGLALR